MRGQVGVAHQRADAQAAVCRHLDLVQRQAIDVDEMRRRLDLEFHEIEKVGAAGDELGAVDACCGRGGFGREFSRARS